MERTAAVEDQLWDIIEPLQELLSLMPIASAIVSAEETLPILSANSECYSLLHITPKKEIRYLNAEEVDCMRLYQEFQRSAKFGKTLETEFCLNNQKDNNTWIRLYASYYGQIEKIDLYLCCFMDITEEKEQKGIEKLSKGVDFYWQSIADKNSQLKFQECKAERKTSDEQFRDIIDRKEWFKRDRLTNVWQREYFFDVINKQLKESNAVFQIIALDLDKFKYINEYYGRGTGNMVLNAIAERLRNIFGKNAAIARSYADKFYVCVQKEGLTEEEIHSISYNKIKLENGKSIKVSVKMGIFSYDASSKMHTGDECVNRALMARSIIKGCHDKSYSVYTAELEEKIQKENEIENMMEKALEQQEYVVYYQPKFSLTTGKLVGAEALVRWNSPEKGMISPGVFVPLFEKNGFIIKLDFYVYEEVCRFVSELIKQGIDIVPISINVSRAHIETADFVEKLTSIVDNYKIPHHYLEIEMTESIYGAENKNVVCMVNRLKKLGFTLSMDDFGSGYSSLNLLKNMPIDVLKIDKEFLGETDTSKRSREIVRMIVEMSKAIDIKTICEGVETDQQAEFLKKIGCDMVQGFLFARPMPEQSYLQVIKENSAVG